LEEILRGRSVAPNQQTIYPEYTPGYADRAWPETRLDQLTRRLRERNSALNFIDPRPELFAARSRGILYHQYESHWNALGAFVTYSAIMQRVKGLFPEIVPLKLDDFTPGTLTQTWNVPPKSEVVPTLIPKRPSAIISRNKLEITPNLYLADVLTNLAKAPSVLMYGDSFTETFLQDYCNESFRSTIFVPTWTMPFPAEMIKKYHPDLVIFEFVERSLPNPLVGMSEIGSAMTIREAPPLASLLKASRGLVGGTVDGIDGTGDNVRLNGWAADLEAKTPSKVILAYWDDKAIGTASPSFDRPDAARGFADQEIGFVLRVHEMDAQRENHELRVFAINADRSVAELQINPRLWDRLRELLGVRRPPE
jgi:SGNH hydrolase-like domain, acetyltransferase AlgX